MGCGSAVVRPHSRHAPPHRTVSAHTRAWACSWIRNDPNTLCKDLSLVGVAWIRPGGRINASGGRDPLQLRNATGGPCPYPADAGLTRFQSARWAPKVTIEASNTAEDVTQYSLGGRQHDCCGRRGVHITRFGCS